ncbi:MAG: DUF2612 domain-containing protein [Sutterella sp.]|nr:DUF2612 domain-containing protein [Sutterella sp.]
MSTTQTFLDIGVVDDFAGVSDFTGMDSPALQPQYSHTKRIRGLGMLFRDQIDASYDMDNFLFDVFDPSTAQGVFLDMWGEKVGAKRNLIVDGTEVRLSDEAYRFLVFYKALANVSDSTTETLNRLLTKLLKIRVFVLDRGDMTIAVHVLGRLSSEQRAIFKALGLYTRGAGVGFNIYVIDPNVFGFIGSLLNPFNQAPFGTTDSSL